MRASFDDRLSGLIGELYDAALDGRQWQGIAPRIAGAFDSTSTVVKMHSGADVQILQCTENMLVPESRRDWAEHWHQRDLWVERTVKVGLSKIVTDRGLVTREEQRKSGFYQEWLRALDIFHVVGAAFPAGEDSVGVLGIHRPRDGRYYGRTDVRRVALLLPHLQRALQLTRHLASVRHAVALDALEKLDTGVLVVNRRCRILHANSLATEILAGASQIRATGGHLALEEPGLQEQLARQVRRAVETAAGQPNRPEAVLAVPRGGRLPLTLAIAPLRPMGVLAPPRPLALVFLRDPEYPAMDAKKLRDLFGLTPAEAAVARDLGRGRSLEEIARKRRVGMATVRSHLKQILAKTGTRRQAETVALIARSVAALGLRDASPE